MANSIGGSVMALASGRRHQRGITLTGMIIASALLFAVLVTFMKMWPLLNEWMKIRNTLAYVSKQPGVSTKSKRDIYDLMLRNMEVNDVDTFHERNIGQAAKVLRDKKTGRKVVRMNYEKRGPLFGPFDLVLKIDESVMLP